MKRLKKILLALSIIMIALVFSPTTFSYWVDINNVALQNNAGIPIGRWDEGKKLFINNNLSNNFSNHYISIDFGEPFGQERYDNLPQSPTPKTHSGVLQSDYVFDGWYFDNGTKLTASTILQGDETIYPSWNSTNNWTYTKSGSIYNIKKQTNAMFSGDLYVPGWRYKGLTINSLSAMSTSAAPLEVNGLWVGEGIKAIANTTFRYSSVSSLVLEEGIETIGESAFANISNTGASLILPNSLKTINQYAFRDMTYSGTLGISPDSNLETISQYSFNNSGFTGSLYLPSTLKTIGNAAFQKNNFNGTLDISNATQLTQINQFTFNNNNFIGDLKLPSEITTVGHSSFAKAFNTNNNRSNGKLDLSEAKKLTSIGTTAFQENNFTSVDFALGGVLNSIAAQAFQNNKIQEFKLPRSLTTVAGVAFAGNPIISMYVPQELTSMGSSGGLKNVTIYFEASSSAGWDSTWFKASDNNDDRYEQILPY